MINKLRDIEDMNTEMYLSILINYLAVLQDGRTKPDTHSGGYIRESLYNIDEIQEVKDKINDILRIKTVPASVEFRDATTKRTYKY